VCYKYVTDVSNLAYLSTDLPYVFRKNSILLRVYIVYAGEAVCFVYAGEAKVNLETRVR